MENSKLASLILLVAGAILISYGLAAADSVGSAFSRLFTGAPTDKTVWLLIAGTLCAVAGLGGLLRRSN